MKALKEFDYNLWTTEENGNKKYWVGIKATGEITEVDIEVMKLLRCEEKKMWRYIEKQSKFGAPLSLDKIADEPSNEEWLTDSYDLCNDVQTEIMESAFIGTLSPLQKSVYEYCIRRVGNPTNFATEKGISKQAVTNTLRKIREKAKKYFL